MMIWFRAAVAIFAAAVSTASLAALPEGFRVDAAADLVLNERGHKTCKSCIELEISNPTQVPLIVSLGIKPLPTIEAEDRSFGGWIYSYSHELLGVDGDVQMAPEEGQTPVQGIASRRRFDLRVLTFEDEAAEYTAGSFSVELTIGPGAQRRVIAYNGKTVAKELTNSPPERYLYWTLWQPLRLLCLWVEKTIGQLLPVLGAFGVIALIVVVVRAITFPINRWSFRSQQHFEAIQKSIAPEITDIKSRLKGGDQSEAILELYQSKGVNPLSGLKGSVGLFVQIPILIAMFNVASDSAVFSGVPMGWVTDIAQPEHNFNWGLDLPLLGTFFNAIAAGLAIFMVWSELSKPQRSSGSLLFAIVVGVLLYSFPVFLVVYWFLITVAQYVEQKLATR